jgi:hypothetical protein
VSAAALHIPAKATNKVGRYFFIVLFLVISGSFSGILPKYSGILFYINNLFMSYLSQRTEYIITKTYSHHGAKGFLHDHTEDWVSYYFSEHINIETLKIFREAYDAREYIQKRFSDMPGIYQIEAIIFVKDPVEANSSKIDSEKL